jgi:sugar lactone lactonase YvrE
MQNSRVLAFMAPFSNNMTPSIVLGQQGFSNNWGSGWYANQMTYPTQITFDQHGGLWVADTYNSRVIEFIPPFRNGMNAILVIGQKVIPPSVPMPDWSSTVPRSSRNGLSSPNGIAFDTAGDLWVADSWNGRVLEFQAPFSNNMNASLVIGERDFTSSCNDLTRPLCGDSRTLMMPTAVAFDSAGNLWVTDTINSGTYATTQWQRRLLEFNPPFKNGMNASLVIKEPAGSSLAFDPSGNLWLSSSGATSGNVSEYSPPFATSMKASLVMQGIDTIGDPNPYGLRFDSAGNLWVEANYLLAFNAPVHPIDTAEGRVYFRNDEGLLAPLSSVPCGVGLVSFVDGLFNFTIQGLPRGDSVKVTMTFPKPLPSDAVWWRIINGSPCGMGESGALPANQTLVNGNNMTITLSNASTNGVISMMGGPAFPLETPTSTSVSSTISTSISSSSSSTNIPGFPVESIIGGIIAGLAALTILRYRRQATEF